MRYRSKPAWYSWTSGCEQTSSLLNPLHASLLGQYLQTRDPEAWEALRASLLITPWRARTNAEQAESLRNSAMVRFLTDNVGTGADYGQYMAMAGDPIQLALMLLPVGRATEAIVGGIKHGGVRVAAATGLNVGLGAGLGMVGAAVENPNATWEDYKEAAKHGVISALTMQAVGTVYGKGVKEVERALAKRAAERAAPESAAPEKANPPQLADPAHPPPAEPPNKEAATKPGAEAPPRAALPPSPEPPLPQQTPEAWAAPQKEYAQYDAELSPDQQFAALRREFPDADPRALGRIVAEFDPAQGLSLATTAREKLGLPDPARPAGAASPAPSHPLSPDIARPSANSVNNRPLIKGSALDQWADKVIAGARGNLNSGLDPTVAAAYSVKGAALIENGLRNFAEWSQRMVTQFGEHIRPHLKELWQKSSEHFAIAPKEETPGGKNAGDDPSKAGIYSNPPAPLANIGQSQRQPKPVGPKVNFEPSPNLEWHVNFDEGRHLAPTSPFDANRKPRGPLKVLPKNDVDPGNRRGCDGENEAAVVLPQNGYDYDQVLRTKRKRADGTFEGVQDGAFSAAPQFKSDVYSPAKTKSLKGIHDEVTDKVERQNSPYVVVRLEPDGQSIHTIVDYFSKHPIKDLNQLFVIQSGKLHIAY